MSSFYTVQEKDKVIVSSNQTGETLGEKKKKKCEMSTLSGLSGNMRYTATTGTDGDWGTLTPEILSNANC